MSLGLPWPLRSRRSRV